MFITCISSNVCDKAAMINFTNFQVLGYGATTHAIDITENIIIQRSQCHSFCAIIGDIQGIGNVATRSAEDIR